LKHPILIALIFIVVVQTIASAREWLVIRPATAEQTEIDAERVLEKMDDYLRQRGFHSKVVDETTASGFHAALQWSNPAVANFTTYTHRDGRLGLACDCVDASAGSSECHRVFAHLRSMCDKRWQVRAVQDL
jgi:hypothetical protein